MPTAPRYLTRRVRPSQVNEGDVIRHLDGAPARVTRTTFYSDEYGYVCGFAFEGDRVPYAERASTGVMEKLTPVPERGTPASLCYPSDRYPLIVVGSTPSGKTLKLARLDYRIVSGSFQGGDAVVEYSMPDSCLPFPTEASVLTARWSAKRGGYTVNGTPVAIGHARFYQSPEV